MSACKNRKNNPTPGAMAQFDIRRASAPDVARTHIPKSDMDKLFADIRTKKMKPQRSTDSFEFSAPSQPKFEVTQSAVKADSDVFSQSSVSIPSAKLAWSYTRHEPNGPRKPKILSSPDSDDGMENIPKGIRIPGMQNKLKGNSFDSSVPMKKLPDLLVLGDPPAKPNRPPNVDIDHLQRSKKSLDDGPKMKLPHHIAVVPHPPLVCVQPPSNFAPVSNQQLCKDVGFKNPPSHPNEGHPSQMTEAKWSEDMYEEVDTWMEQAERSKSHQEHRSGEEYVNYSGVTAEELAAGKGQTEKRKKKLKTKDKRRQDAIKLPKRPLHRPACVTETEKAHKAFTFKGGDTGFCLNQGGIIHNAGLTETEDPGYEEYDEYKEEYEEYDDIGILVDRYQNEQNAEEDEYLVVLDPETRFDIYDEVDEDIYEVN